MGVLRWTTVFSLALVFVSRVVAQIPSTNRIVEELRSGQAQEALHDVTAALQATPRDARLWTLKGMAERQTSGYEVSVRSFKRALALEPAYVPALEGICEELYAHEPMVAVPYLHRLLQLTPDNPNANGMAAVLAYRTLDYKGAADFFTRAEPVFASNQQAMNTYADTMARLDRREECERILSLIVEKWSSDKGARLNLGALQHSRGANSMALKTLEPLIESKDEAALSLAATVEETIGDTPRAVELLKKAIQADPKNPQNYVDFATLSFDHNSPKAGIVMLNAGLEQLPEVASLYAARGILLMQISETSGGERDFKRANQLDPWQSFGREAQGVSAIQQHNLPGALAMVKDALAKTPENAYLNYMAAQILKTSATSEESSATECLAYAHKAVLLEPRLIAAWDIVSAQELSAGHLKEAQQAAQTALQLDPTDQEAVFRLMIIARRSGDSSKVASLVERLKTLKDDDYSNQQRINRYRLLEPGQLQDAPLSQKEQP